MNPDTLKRVTTWFTWSAPRALRARSDQTLILALDTSVLFEKFCLIRVSVVFWGRTAPLFSHAFERPSAQVSIDHLLPVLAEVKGLQDFVGIHQVRWQADRGFCNTDLPAWLRFTSVETFAEYGERFQIGEGLLDEKSGLFGLEDARLRDAASLVE